jgi:hypothetical protein
MAEAVHTSLLEVTRLETKIILFSLLESSLPQRINSYDFASRYCVAFGRHAWLREEE